MHKKTSREILAAKLQAASDAGRTDEDIGGKAGITQPHVGKLRRAKTACTLDTLDGIARALGVQPWELLLDDDALREAIYRRVISKD